MLRPSRAWAPRARGNRLGGRTPTDAGTWPGARRPVMGAGHVNAEGIEHTGAGHGTAGGRGLALRPRSPGRGRLGTAAGRRQGSLRRRLRLLQPARPRLRRRTARGQAAGRGTGHRHPPRRPLARGARHRDRHPGRLQRRRLLRAGPRPVHRGEGRRERHTGGPLRPLRRHDRDGLRARRVLPAPGRLEVPRRRPGLQQRTRRTGHRLRHHRGRTPARRPARRPAGPAHRPPAAPPVAPPVTVPQPPPPPAAPPRPSG